MAKQVRKTKKHESGRSMIEMVGVLAVMGLITAGAFVLITSALRSQRLSRADDDVSVLVSGTRMLYANTSTFPSVKGQDVLEALGMSKAAAPYGGTYALVITPALVCVNFTTDTSQATCNSLKSRPWGAGTPDAGTSSCAADKNGIYTLNICFPKEQQ